MQDEKVVGLSTKLQLYNTKRTNATNNTTINISPDAVMGDTLSISQLEIFESAVFAPQRTVLAREVTTLALYTKNK